MAGGGRKGGLTYPYKGLKLPPIHSALWRREFRKFLGEVMYEVKGHWRTAAMAATVVLVASGVTGALPTALPGQFAPNAAAQTTGISPTEYLTNTWTSDPPTYEGNLSDSTNCIVKWQTQAVYSSQLGPLSGGLSPSIRGFLQDVMYGDYPTGKLQLQHFPSGKNVAWRLPIAVDQQIKGATLVIDFDDPDYDKTWADTMTAAKVSQNPGWWDAPGVNPAYPEGRTWFQRFTGISGYVPLSDKPLPVRVDAAARKIYVDLGDMPAKSSTVLSFSAVPANGLTAGATNNPLSYGLRATLDGSSIYSCYNPSYASQNVVVGSSGNQFPAPTDPTRPLPAGTTFAIAPGYQPPAGWSIAVDPATGAMTVTPGPDAVPGQAVNVPVLVTYRDGTTDTAIAPLVVQDNEAGLNTPGYEAGNVKPGESLTLQQTADTDLPPGTRFSVPSDFTPPAGWTYSIDPATGAVNVQAPPGAQPGDRIDVPVTVTYPDGTTDNAMASIVVIPNDAQANSPAYDQATTKPGVAVDISQVGDTSMPDGTQYTLDGYTPPTGWSVTIDSQTGALTVTPPADANPGDSIAVPVVIKYPDGSTQTVTAPVVVTANDAQLNSPGYEPATTQPGTPVPVPQTGDVPLPDGTRYRIADGYTPPAGWTATVDAATGVVTVTPPADAPNGAAITVPIVVSYPDQSLDDTQVSVTVTVLDNVAYTPNYNLVSTKPGTTVTSPQLASDLPSGTTFAITDGFQVPAGWTITVDEATGEVTFVVPPDAAPTTVVAVPITVRYPDGTTGAATAQVKVEQSNPGDTIVDRGTIEPGQTIVLDPQDPNLYPPGTVFRFPDGWTPPAGWEVSFDQDKRQLTITAPPTAQPGDVIAIPMYITAPDGREFNRTVLVTVVEPKPVTTDADRHNPAYPTATTKPGQQVTVEQNGDTLPAGTTCSIVYQPQGWEVTLGANCEVIATPPAGVALGTYAVQVRFTYPDGSEDTTFADITVADDTPAESDAQKYNPGYTEVTGAPGETVSVPQTGDTVPAGTTCTLGTPPAGWTVTIGADCTLQVTVPNDAADGTYDIPVQFTYPDGTSETVNAKVTVGEPSGGGSIGELDLGSLGGDGEGSLGGSTGGSSGEGGSGSLGSLGSLGSTGGSSTGSLLGLGSLALGGLAIGGLVWAVNNHLIMLPPGFVLPPFLAPFFPGLVEQPPLPPAPPAPGPDVDNGRG